MCDDSISSRSQFVAHTCLTLYGRNGISRSHLQSLMSRDLNLENLQILAGMVTIPVEERFKDVNTGKYSGCIQESNSTLILGEPLRSSSVKHRNPVGPEKLLKELPDRKFVSLLTPRPNGLSPVRYNSDEGNSLIPERNKSKYFRHFISGSISGNFSSLLQQHSSKDSRDFNMSVLGRI